MPVFSVRGPVALPAAAVYDNTETQDWVTAVVSDGGAVSATQGDRVDTLISNLKGHSLWAKLDHLWLYAGESDIHQAKIDIKGLLAHTVNSLGAIGAVGYTGNGSGYINTNFTPAGGGTQYSKDSACYGVAVHNNPASSALCTLGARIAASSLFCDFFTRADFVGDNFFARQNCAPADSVNAGIGTRTGLWVITTTADTVERAYRNGSSTAIASGSYSTVALTGLPNFCVLARNDDGSVGSFSLEQVSCSFFGSGMTGAEAANLMTDINTYLTAWGIGLF